MDALVAVNAYFFKRDLYEVWRVEKLNKKNAIFEYVKIKLRLTSTKDISEKSRKTLIHFADTLSKKWKKCSRTKTVFEAKNLSWLDQTIQLSLRDISSLEMLPTASTSRRGRPESEFDSVSDRAKKKKVSQLLENFTCDQISFAAHTKLYSTGKRSEASVIKEVTCTSPQRASKIKKAFHKPPTQPIKYTPEEALSLYIDGHYTKASYIRIQTGAKFRKADIYPSYDALKKAKTECYPASSITVTETSATVDLQGLLDHTTKRIVKSQEEVLEQFFSKIKDGLTLTIKWGCDGSGGHSTYKQKFGEANKTDSNLYSVCLVPLQLVPNNNKKEIIWQNPRPSSTRFCRPIKIIFEKESPAVVANEIKEVENQIKKLTPTIITIKNQIFTVKYTLKLTMIDGKTFSVVSASSSQTCGICGATPKLMNKLELIYKRTPKESLYEYGLSSLHAYIRMFECLLHIAYRLNIKKWQMRHAADKEVFKQNKKNIIDKIKSDMGLLVDIPKPGYGIANDGNTASRFFENYTLAASVTGIDEDLIKRFGVILNTISCGFAVNIENFDRYARETAHKYVSLYSWYPMPSSVHKILIHGVDIIKSATLPIGMLSEEALEARNKDLRRYRELHTRKFSREKSMRDLINSLLFSLDPLISSISRENNKSVRYSNKCLSIDVIRLLAEPEIIDVANDDEDDNEIAI